MRGLVIGPGRELTYVSVVSALIDASTSAHHYIRICMYLGALWFQSIYGN